MSQKKDPKDYQYGKPCEDHLGNKFRTIKDMCIYHGIPPETYQSRKKRGWELERILTTPVKNYVWRNPYRNMGIPLTKADERRYSGYEEIPGSRSALEVYRRAMMEQQEKDADDGPEDPSC